MKILFFGTSAFALPSLAALGKSDFEISGVVTQPDKPAGRNQEPLPLPVKTWAIEQGLRVFQPERLQIKDLRLETVVWDLGIAVSYGNIIPKEILDAPQYGILNVHPSLLPKYRGPSPLQSAILNGEEETGVTIIKLDQEMDHGDIVATTNYKLQTTKMGYQKLHDELASLGAQLLVKILPDYLAGKIKLIPQDHRTATFTKLIAKEDGRIDWKKSADKIERQVRAFESWPVAWTTLEGKTLKIYKALYINVIPALARESRNWIPGQARDDKKNGRLFVQTGSGQLEILSLQLEGRKKMSAKEFLNGYRELQGKVLV